MTIWVSQVSASVRGCMSRNGRFSIRNCFLRHVSQQLLQSQVGLLLIQHKNRQMISSAAIKSVLSFSRSGVFNSNLQKRFPSPR